MRDMADRDRGDRYTSYIDSIIEREFPQAPLVSVGAVVVHDAETAEEVVQDAFASLYGAWSRLHETSKARAYLRQSVVNGSMSVLRHRAVENKYAVALASEESTEQEIIILLERSALVAALRRLPGRQREAVVLRFYADLSEADVAKAMGISRGTVKSHVARGVFTLRGILDPAASPGYGYPAAAPIDRRHGSINSLAGRRAAD